MILSFDLWLGVEQRNPNIRLGRSCFIIQSHNLLKDAYQNFNQTAGLNFFISLAEVLIGVLIYFWKITENLFIFWNETGLKTSLVSRIRSDWTCLIKRLFSLSLSLSLSLHSLSRTYTNTLTHLQVRIRALSPSSRSHSHSLSRSAWSNSTLITIERNRSVSFN